MPPPAAATHSLQSPAWQAGAIASAVTRPDSCVPGPRIVSGVKNWGAPPATFGVFGPRLDQAAGATASAVRNALLVRNAERGARLGTPLNARRTFSARRSST